MIELTIWIIVSAVVFDLTSLIQGITETAMNVVEVLIFLAFVVGLGAFVIPYIEHIQAWGKALMVRTTIGQVLSTIIFGWLSSIGA